MNGVNILIVDDHEPVRRNLRHLVESQPGWRVCAEAGDGMDAIEKAKQLHPGLILMDISMPRMDGLQATRALRRELPQSKILLVSQNDPRFLGQQAAEAGAHGFVEKMNLFRDLIPAIQNVFRESAQDLHSLATAESSENRGSSWLTGDSSVAALIRQTDFSKTALGPIESWGPTLRMMVKFLLANRFPQLLWWGPQFCSLYNDAYVPILGGKHPWAIGRPLSEVWHEIWTVLQPLVETPFHGGPATWMEDIPLEIKRRGFVEETHFTVAYSPVPDDSAPGGIGGVLATVHEITEKVVGERRVVILRDLGTSTEPVSVEESCAVIAQTLSKHPKDVPFALVYLLDADLKTARLAGSTGVDAQVAASLHEVDLSSRHALWPFAAALETGELQVVTDLQSRLCPVPPGPWSDPPNTAAVVPIASFIAHQPAGFLLAGISSRLQLDPAYRGFLQLMCGQVSTVIANARAYQQERQRAEALAQIDRAKTAFFSNVSHEFRTPLTLMLGPLQDLLARGDSEMSPGAIEQLQLVNRGGNRLLRLVNTLLDFSRIEAGRVEAKYQPTDIAALTVELASMFRSATERAGLLFNVNCSPVGEPVYVDRDMWEKIVLNLVSNAFKFTFNGEIVVSIRRQGDSAELQVNDTGAGIAAEEMPRLFERFHRVPNAQSRTYEGSGIGLALVQELVKLHGGAIRAESQVGRGTTFVVHVPLGYAHLPAAQVGVEGAASSRPSVASSYVEEALGWLPDQSGSADEAPYHFGVSPNRSEPPRGLSAAARPRVLVADDNSDMRTYLTRLLAGHFQVETVADGQAALDRMRQSPPDLLLSDAMMPRVDGLELIRQLRADTSLHDIPVILLSARAGEESRLEGVETGADDYLVKPFSARELVARVEGHVKMHRLRSEAKERQRQLALEFEALLNQAPVGIYLLDGDLRIRQVNTAAMPVFSSIPDLIGRDLESVVRLVRGKARAAEVVPIFRNTLLTGESYEAPHSVEYEADDGAKQYFDWRVDRIPLPDGGYGVVCYFRDVSEQVRAHSSIVESEQRLRIATDAAQLGIWHWYPDEDRATWENDQMYEIMGRPRALGPVSSTEFREKFLHPDHAEAFAEKLTQSLQTGERFHFQARIYRGDGQLRWLEFTGQFELKVDGSRHRLLGTAQDISERKFIEESYRKLAEDLDLEVRARTRDLEDRNFEILRQAEQLRELSRSVLQAQDKERRHIARELHDSAGQTLAVLSMSLGQLVRETKTRDERLAGIAEQAEALAQQLNKEIRTTSYLLHPPLLDESGLGSALHWYARGLSQRTGLKIELNIPEDFGRIPRDLELAVFRMVQESLTNIHRHSEAKSARIAIAQQDHHVVVDVQDDGRGMSPARLSEIRSGGSGLGIRGMRERMHQFLGQMDIQSNSSGTRVSVTIPLPESAPAMNEEPERPAFLA